MNPEELDRLFREKLENLDSIQELSWSEDLVWAKIETGVKGNWGLKTFGYKMLFIAGLLLAIYGAYHLSENSEEAGPTQKTVPTPVDTIHVDTVKKKLITQLPTRVQHKKNRTPVLGKDSSTTILSDTSGVQKDSVTVVFSAVGQMWHRRRQMMNQLKEEKNFRFSLPPVSFSKMKVDNSFNVTNLIKSIQAEKQLEDNRYYFYEYNKSYIPPPYQNTSPKFQRNSIYIFNTPKE